MKATPFVLSHGAKFVPGAHAVELMLALTEDLLTATVHAFVTALRRQGATARDNTEEVTPKAINSGDGHRHPYTRALLMVLLYSSV